jgi:sugar O-acyltransferase (sialic acid O-acetyltransferase NeuD family)
VLVHGRYSFAGFVDRDLKVGEKVLSHEVIGGDGDLERLSDEVGAALIGVGHIKSPEPRRSIFGMLMKLGFDLPTLVSPHAYVSDLAEVGVGTIVMHGSIVNAGARVGENCILNTQSLIEHDVVVGNHSHISTGAKLNGCTRVGDGCFVGSGAVLRHEIEIGDETIIGAGCVVMKNQPSGTRICESVK